MSDINIAILGYGLVGKRHVKAINDTDDINLIEHIK